MTVRYLGSVTLGASLPGAAAVSVAGAAGINSVLPDLLAQLASLLAWKPEPIDLSVQLSTLQSMIASINAQVALNVPAPSLARQLETLATMIAALQGKIAALELQLEVIGQFEATLGAAGVHLLAFEGAVSAHGPQMAARLASVPGLGPLDVCHALTLLTTVPATWAALASILKTTP